MHFYVLTPLNAAHFMLIRHLSTLYFCVCMCMFMWLTWMFLQSCLFVSLFHIRGPFEKFVNSPYFSESELGGGAVTVSLSKYLPWQAMHFLKRSTHFLKTCRKLQEDSGTGDFDLLITLKPQLISLLRLHRLDGRIVGFPIHFSQTKHRIQSRNADAPLRRYDLVAPPS
jgi:hypothetical protein